MPTERRVILLALASRLAILLLMTGSGLLISKYDTSSSLLNFPCHAERTKPLLSGPSSGWGQPRLVWDSVFFARIAKCGYEYEQYHAFFPLLPAVLKVVQKIGPRASSALAEGDSALAVAGLGVSNTAFISSAVYFHRLSHHVLKDARLAALATLMYCASPASVFLSAIYTESLFALLSLAGMYYVVCGHHWWATVCFSLSTATRSNGVLACWFLVYPALQHMLMVSAAKGLQLRVLVPLVATAAQCMLVVAPLPAFQVYGYYTFCRGSVQPVPDWCAARVPYLYGHVQARYWGVGFLRYWQLKQVPNFLLAAPALLLAFTGCYAYAAHDPRRALTLGLWPTLPVGSKEAEQPSNGTSKQSSKFFRDRVAPYMHHWGFMAVFAALFMHVQVATRFMASCPALYWWAAHLYTHRGHQYVWSYFTAYCLLGSLLFTSFYPWT